MYVYLVYWIDYAFEHNLIKIFSSPAKAQDFISKHRDKENCYLERMEVE